MGNKIVKSVDPSCQTFCVLYLGTRDSFDGVRGVKTNNGLLMMTSYQSDIIWIPNKNRTNIFSTKNPNFVIQWPAFLTTHTYLQCWGEVGETLSDDKFLELLSKF